MSKIKKVVGSITISVLGCAIWAFAGWSFTKIYTSGAVMTAMSFLYVFILSSIPLVAYRLFRLYIDEKHKKDEDDRIKKEDERRKRDEENKVREEDERLKKNIDTWPAEKALLFVPPVAPILNISNNKCATYEFYAGIYNGSPYKCTILKIICNKFGVEEEETVVDKEIMYKPVLPPNACDYSPIRHKFIFDHDPLLLNKYLLDPKCQRHIRFGCKLTFYARISDMNDKYTKDSEYPIDFYINMQINHKEEK